mgnify:CR=1 FL=1
MKTFGAPRLRRARPSTTPARGTSGRGANEEVPVDVRILSATHKNLGQLVDRGEFRQDLFYRVNVIELHVPRLRERIEDIGVLANHFLSN